MVDFTYEDGPASPFISVSSTNGGPISTSGHIKARLRVACRLLPCPCELIYSSSCVIVWSERPLCRLVDSRHSEGPRLRSFVPSFDYPPRYEPMESAHNVLLLLLLLCPASSTVISVAHITLNMNVCASLINNYFTGNRNTEWRWRIVRRSLFLCRCSGQKGVQSYVADLIISKMEAVILKDGRISRENWLNKKKDNRWSNDLLK